jgi:hypothetical protein
MKTLTEKQQLPVREHWKLKAYPRGTVKLGMYLDVARPDGGFRFRGNLIIPSARPVISLSGHNLITTAGKGLVADMLIDVSGYDTGLTYQLLGTGDTAPAITDTQLTTEAVRKAVTSKSRLGAVVTLSTFFAAGECTLDLAEAGVAGHSTASATPDSGVLFSHYLAAFDNTGGLYDLTYDYVLTLG